MPIKRRADIACAAMELTGGLADTDWRLENANSTLLANSRPSRRRRRQK